MRRLPERRLLAASATGAGLARLEPCPHFEMSERAPDETIRIAVDGHEVVAYSFGAGKETLLLANGGPGLPCDYLREPHAQLADAGFRVVAWDQLGCGQSDKPLDPSLWTIKRYAAETETVRAALGAGPVHLLGQSWGSFLALEYALSYPDGAKSLIIANGAADIPHLLGEMRRLRHALGPETEEMMQRHEAQGSLDHPEYEAAITLLYRRHICRCDEWPAPLERTFASMNKAVYGAMWGANEYCVTGSLKGWSRLADLPRITVPTLVVSGMHDELVPESSGLIVQGIPYAELASFTNSSHMPFYEEPDAYFARLTKFLKANSGS
jgi:proline iminopeptidase